MEYKKAETKLLKGLIPIYRQAYSKHNIFSRTSEEIESYLIAKHEENSPWGGGFILAIEEENIIGGILIKKTGGNKSHLVARYNHIAVAEEYRRKGIGKALISAADNAIKDLISDGTFNSAKIELGLSDNEKELLGFYERAGFEIEGKLKSHYRKGEAAYILGKEM